MRTPAALRRPCRSPRVWSCSSSADWVGAEWQSPGEDNDVVRVSFFPLGTHRGRAVENVTHVRPTSRWGCESQARSAACALRDSDSAGIDLCSEMFKLLLLRLQDFDKFVDERHSDRTGGGVSHRVA